MKADFARDPFRNRSLERFVGEDVFLREINVPGRVVEQAVLVPGRSFEIPDVAHHEEQGQEAEHPDEALVIPKRGCPDPNLLAAGQVRRQEEKQTR